MFVKVIIFLLKIKNIRYIYYNYIWISRLGLFFLYSLRILILLLLRQ
jgi:hypothetical protein